MPSPKTTKVRFELKSTQVLTSRQKRLLNKAMAEAMKQQIVDNIDAGVDFRGQPLPRLEGSTIRYKRRSNIAKSPESPLIWTGNLKESFSARFTATSAWVYLRKTKKARYYTTAGENGVTRLHAKGSAQADTHEILKYLQKFGKKGKRWLFFRKPSGPMKTKLIRLMNAYLGGELVVKSKDYV